MTGTGTREFEKDPAPIFLPNQASLINIQVFPLDPSNINLNY